MRKLLFVLALIAIALASSPVAAHTPPAVYVVCQLDDEEMVCEVIMARALFDAWFDWNPDQLDQMEPEKAAAAKRSIEKYMDENCPLKVDGIAIPAGFKLLTVQKLTDHGMNYEFARFKTVYGLKGRPRTVEIAWHAFDNPIDWWLEPVEAEISGYGSGIYLALTKEEPGYQWHVPRTPQVPESVSLPVVVEPPKIPVPMATVAVILLLLIIVPVLLFRHTKRLTAYITAVGLILAFLLSPLAKLEVASPWGPSFRMPDVEGAKYIFEALHRNIYRAFDYETEDQVYDTLAGSVRGDLLERVYEEIYNSLIQRDQGGAVSKIQFTEILESDVEFPDDPEAHEYYVTCRWRVHGKVTHYGHSHLRINEYLARYTVAWDATGWKIKDVEVLDEKRLAEQETRRTGK